MSSKDVKNVVTKTLGGGENKDQDIWQAFEHILKQFSIDIFCDNSLRSLDKLIGLLNYPYKFKL